MNLYTIINKNIFYCVILFYLFSQNVFSETILLRNGNAKKGKIVSQDKLTIIFTETGEKNPVVFSKKEILKISYKDLTQSEINQILKDSGEPEILNVSPGSPVADPMAGRYKISFGKALLRSAILPGWGQMYQSRKIAGTAYFFLFLGGAGFLGYQFKEYKSSENDYNYRGQSYLFSLYLSDYSSQFLARKELFSQKGKMDKALHRAEIAGGVFVGIYLLNLFDVVVFRPRDNLSLRASAFSDQMSLKLEYSF